MAFSVRSGRPNSTPQLTPAPLAMTSPSSTARPGEKCWPASSRAPRTNIERPTTIPDRKTQQYTATDAGTVGNDIPEFHGAAGGEMLAGFEQSSEDEHRKAHYDSSAFIPESDHWQK